FATTFLIRLAYLTLVLTLCSTASTATAHEKEGFVVLPNQAPRFSGPAGSEEDITEILATREQTGGSFGVWRTTKVMEGGPPLHIHRTEDEFFYVVSGEFNFQLGDCITRTPAGSFVYIPKDIPTVSPLLTPVSSRNALLLQSLPTNTPFWQVNSRRRKDDTRVGTAARGIVARLPLFPALLHSIGGR